jgi:hypothetical protein
LYALAEVTGQRLVTGRGSDFRLEKKRTEDTGVARQAAELVMAVPALLAVAPALTMPTECGSTLTGNGYSSMSLKMGSQPLHDSLLVENGVSFSELQGIWARLFARSHNDHNRGSLSAVLVLKATTMFSANPSIGVGSTAVNS